MPIAEKQITLRKKKKKKKKNLKMKNIMKKQNDQLTKTNHQNMNNNIQSNQIQDNKLVTTDTEQHEDIINNYASDKNIEEKSMKNDKIEMKNKMKINMNINNLSQNVTNE